MDHNRALTAHRDDIKTPAPPWLGSVGACLGVGALYLVTAQLSLKLISDHTGVPLFWPASGIAAGALITFAPGWWTPASIGIVAASTATSLLNGRGLTAALLLAFCQGAEALVIAWLLRHRFAGDFRLDSLRQVLGFFAVAGLATAVTGVATSGLMHGSPGLSYWLNCFAADALGIILLAPLLIGLAGLRQEWPERPELVQVSVTLAALAVSSVIVFRFPVQYWYIVLPLALLLPVLLAAHYRPVFAAGAILILSAAVIWAATFGIGGFGDVANLHDRAYAARAILLAIATCTLVLAALFAERRHNEAALKDANGRLQLALDAAELGVWSIDAKTGRFESDARDKLIHGHAPNAPTTLAEARPFIHQEDLPRLDGAFAASRRAGSSCKVEYRLAPSFAGPEPAPERWVAVEGAVVSDAAGEPLRWLGVTRDITHRKRAEQALAERDEQLALAGKVALVGSFTYDIASGSMQVSQGYAAIHDLPEACAETPRSEWRRRVHPDDLANLDRHFEAAVAERRRDHSSEYRILRHGGEIRWIESRSLISYDRDGFPQRIVGTNIDVTQRKQTEAALAASEACLADALAAGQVIAFEWNALSGRSRRSETAAAILGPEPDVGAGNDFFRRVHPEDRDGFRARIRQLRPEKPAYALAFRFCRRDGCELWLEEEARGEFDGSGKLLRVKGLTRDISERKRAELAIAERNLQLTLAGKAALVGSFAYAIDTEMMQISDGYAAIHGYPDGSSEISRKQWQLGVHPEDLVRLEDLRSHAFRERLDEYGVDYRIVRGGELRWIDARCFIAYRPDGRPQRVVGVNIDITERKRTEQQQRAMNAELDHRVKNVLATINAIIMQTQEAGCSHADFVTALDGRIRSLARTHELLSQNNWRGVLLAELARREFAPYATRYADIGGPSVVLKAESTQAIAIVLHELTTNAVKHGALSTRAGHVLLRWAWKHHTTGHRLAIDWQEKGGPALVRPRRCGYGTSIVRELIPFELGGVANLTFAPDGLKCQLEIPADWIASPPPLDVSFGLPPTGTYN